MVKRQRLFVKRRGIFLAEAILGVMLTVVTLTAVLVAVTAQRRVAIHLANDRDALRIVERAVLDLQQRRPPAASVRVQKLGTPAPPGWQWAEVSGGPQDRIGLTALIPTDAGGGGVK